MPINSSWLLQLFLGPTRQLRKPRNFIRMLATQSTLNLGANVVGKFTHAIVFVDGSDIRFDVLSKSMQERNVVSRVFLLKELMLNPADDICRVLQHIATLKYVDCSFKNLRQSRSHCLARLAGSFNALVATENRFVSCLERFSQNGMCLFRHFELSESRFFPQATQPIWIDFESWSCQGEALRECEGNHASYRLCCKTP